MAQKKVNRGALAGANRGSGFVLANGSQRISALLSLQAYFVAQLCCGAPRIAELVVGLSFRTGALR